MTTDPLENLEYFNALEGIRASKIVLLDLASKEPSRALSLAITKLDEAELWFERDMASKLNLGEKFKDE